MLQFARKGILDKTTFDPGPFFKEILKLGDLNRSSLSFVGTNAKTGEGLEPAIRWLVNDIASRIYIH